MKIAYLSDKPEKLQKVYHDYKGSCYTKADVLCQREQFADTEIIFSTWGMPAFTEQEIETYLPNLKCIFYAAGSVQQFARPFLNKGVRIFSAWAANAVPVAEYTVAQIILANKGFFATAPIAKSGDRQRAKAVLAGFSGNYGAKVGIIGAGMIGSMVIQMLGGYKLEILVFDPFLPEEKAAEMGVRKVLLETLFAECNVISNHLANNAQTQGMLNGYLFEKMRPYATFLNTGRGAQVVENDLIRTLDARPDITAILDVTYPEPPEENSPFYRLPNCILTPHIAGSGGDEVHRMAEYMYTEYEHYLAGKPCRYEVTIDMLQTMA